MTGFDDESSGGIVGKKWLPGGDGIISCGDGCGSSCCVSGTTIGALNFIGGGAAGGAEFSVS